MKLGVICDGISRDLAHAVTVMEEFGLKYAELQFVGAKEVGDHTRQEIDAMSRLLGDHDMKVSCLSRHVFAGLTSANRPGDGPHNLHMDALKRVIEMAHRLSSPLVRIFTQKKETVLWGAYGAEMWNVAKGAWEATLPLVAPAVELARAEGLKLVVETGNGTMINSCYTARRLIDELDAKDALQVLWDPGNACWCHERAYPDGYELVRDGYIGHIHLKDVVVDTPRSRLELRRFGDGQLGPQFTPLAQALRTDGYDGVISLESVFHPGNGDFEAGFRQCVQPFKRTFG
ncbi:MAG: sugar phosphate isomerase/epimerase [Rhodobacteraceae bacterium]|nr:sugar phosphate isomerase/epimerase [Paracoccaceae bacterium]